MDEGWGEGVGDYILLRIVFVGVGEGVCRGLVVGL